MGTRNLLVSAPFCEIEKKSVCQSRRIQEESHIPMDTRRLQDSFLSKWSVPFQLDFRTCRIILQPFGGGVSDFPTRGAGSGLSSSSVGLHVILNTGNCVEHDCRVHDFVHCVPGSILCGGVCVGMGALIGAGATVLPGVHIGEGTTLGAGAVLRGGFPD